jgi:hypothetical protein
VTISDDQPPTMASPTPAPSVVASPPVPPSSAPPLLLPLLLPLEEPLPPDDDEPPLLEEPLELPDAGQLHACGVPVESHVVVPVRAPKQEHVSICPAVHLAPAELVLHPAGASNRAGTAAKMATRMALIHCMVTPCNPCVTAHSCHGRCR